jgi:hypothetical protein
VLGEARQRPEDAHVVLVVGAELEAVALRDDERDLEDVDRVEAEAFAVEGRLGIDRVGRDLEVERFDQKVATSRCRSVCTKAMDGIVLFDPRAGGLDDLLVFAELALHERREPVGR